MNGSIDNRSTTSVEPLIARRRRRGRHQRRRRQSRRALLYRRRETSRQPRYSATVVHSVSRSGAGINIDRRLSVDVDVVFEVVTLGNPAPKNGNLDFSISASCNKFKYQTNLHYNSSNFILYLFKYIIIIE